MACNFECGRQAILTDEEQEPAQYCDGMLLVSSGDIGEITSTWLCGATAAVAIGKGDLCIRELVADSKGKPFPWVANQNGSDQISA